MDNERILLILIVFLFPILIFSCKQDELKVENISLTREGFIFEIEGDKKYYEGIDEFGFNPIDESRGLNYFPQIHPKHIEKVRTESGCKMLWKYKNFVRDDEYWERWDLDRKSIEEMILKYNCEYSFYIYYGHNGFYSKKIIIKNISDNKMGLIDFENINPSDYVITFLE